MYQVAIIGAGQLGSRHLQGLKSASTPLSIIVVDNNDESLKVAKERYDAIEKVGEKTICYVKELESLPAQLDLVIVATGSKPRAGIVRSLLNHAKVKYLVLEKVLFPVLDEYQEISDLLKAKQVKCWVNCPRRMYGLYNQLKKLINPEIPVEIEYAGKNWGLCCNAIHIIDLFMNLTRATDYTIDVSKMDNDIEDSKRGGYIEMTGIIELWTRQGHKLRLVSKNNYQGEFTERVVNGVNTYLISENTGLLSINGVKHEYKTPYQSQLTGIVADDLLINGECPLTPFDLSASYHIPFVEALLMKYNSLTGDNNNKLLPIT